MFNACGDSGYSVAKVEVWLNIVAFYFIFVKKESLRFFGVRVSVIGELVAWVLWLLILMIWVKGIGHLVDRVKIVKIWGWES